MSPSETDVKRAEAGSPLPDNSTQASSQDADKETLLASQADLPPSSDKNTTQPRVEPVALISPAVSTANTPLEAEPAMGPIINTMEVHHRSIDHSKKWKHYLFEFFMLFLGRNSWILCGE